MVDVASGFNRIFAAFDTADVHQRGRTGLVVGHDVKQPAGAAPSRKRRMPPTPGSKRHDAVEFLFCRICKFQRQPSPFAIALGRGFSLRRAVERLEPRRHVGDIAVERDRCRRKRVVQPSVRPTRTMAAFDRRTERERGARMRFGTEARNAGGLQARNAAIVLVSLKRAPKADFMTEPGRIQRTNC